MHQLQLQSTEVLQAVWFGASCNRSYYGAISWHLLFCLVCFPSAFVVSLLCCVTKYTRHYKQTLKNFLLLSRSDFWGIFARTKKKKKY